ncbi:DUF2000 domain-containing protein [Pseudoxanthomonas sp.]|uniref:DUF2000 domain-containing protein n=1 Tax=Pseudoxanthomonas sp. TaxID=1871049 RepID=UPI00262FC5E1|nr:DUF2000 domain-containing protein [Pseudoxanthomonas sp.]WDS34607.1 MAG: DUF2000 domain-containing protein [Pseudoxanthomonas sp.]
MLEDIRIAIIVNPELPLGLLANTVAAIGIGMAAKLPALAGRPLTDAAGRTIDASSCLPVPVLQGDATLIRALLLKALETHQALALVPFPAFARSLHDFHDYQVQFPGRDLQQETLDGVGLAGPAKWIKSVTGALKLLR